MEQLQRIYREMRNSFIAFVLALSLGGFGGQNTANAIIIDNFDDGPGYLNPLTVTADSHGGNPAPVSGYDVTTHTDILGNQREIQVDLTGFSGTRSSGNFQVVVFDSSLNISQSVGAEGFSTIRWDGAAGTNGISEDFNLNADLTDEGNANSFSIDLLDWDRAFYLELIVFDDNADNFASWAWYADPFQFEFPPATVVAMFNGGFGPGDTLGENFIQSGSVDFTSIDAIEIRVAGAPSLDMSFDVIETKFTAGGDETKEVSEPSLIIALLLGFGLVAVFGQKRTL